MARIRIETAVPAGTEIAYARTQARIAAAEQLSLHIVEEEVRPVIAQVLGTVQETDPDTGTITEVSGMVAAPNDGSVDRVLVTEWDFIGGSSGQ